MPTVRSRADSKGGGVYKKRPLRFRLGRFHLPIDWANQSSRSLLYLFLIPASLFVWWLLSLLSRAKSPGQSHIASGGQVDLVEYFQTFSGSTDCGISLPELYIHPKKDSTGAFSRGSFCPNRQTLLEAMAGGGRHGFDAPYTPKGCHYRWYTTDEICMTLERFDALVFLGDESLRTIYSGLNILLRRDLALGALNPSALGPSERTTCRCNNQFIQDTCSKHFITSSDQVPSNTPNAYLCTRTPHAFLPLTAGSPFPPTTLKFLRTLLPQAPPSTYHPIPLILSLTPSSNSPSNTPLTTQTLTDLLTFADGTGRKTPILWLGPPAVGHLDIRRGQVGTNNEIWRFSEEMERVAAEKDVESLAMWNMTVQAGSWDGRRFGERVAVVQAMMVLNWVSRLESS